MGTPEAAPRGRPFPFPSLRAVGKVAAAVLLLAGSGEGEAGRDRGAPEKRWRDGPVRYLLTEDEYRRYGKLKTPEAREAFVERFWRRRDPSPSSPGNEFRDRFEDRRRSADERFSTALDEGWRTDRGIVFILLGEPDVIETRAGDPKSISREVWTYYRPTESSGAPLEIVFYRTQDGKHRLDPEPYGLEVERRALEESRTQERKRLLLVLRRSLPGLRHPQLDLLVESLLLSTPTPWLDGTAGPNRPRRSSAPSPPSTESSAAESRLVEDDTYFFQAENGSVVALFVVSFRPPEDSPDREYTAAVHASERYAGLGATGAATTGPVELGLREDLGRDGRLVFTGRVVLEPGVAYDVRYVVGSVVEQTLAMRHKRVEVPDLGMGRFSTSSIVPAERFGPAPEEASPFAIGSEEVVPRPAATFDQGEPLQLYMQVYGAAESAESGSANVDVTFRFERAGRRGFRRHGKPLSIRGARGASMGLALPVGDWPSGEYRVLVELHDRVARSRVDAEQRFRIVD